MLPNIIIIFVEWGIAAEDLLSVLMLLRLIFPVRFLFYFMYLFIQPQSELASGFLSINLVLIKFALNNELDCVVIDYLHMVKSHLLSSEVFLLRFALSLYV